MSEPFLSQVMIFAFSYAPRGWAQCNGQLLPINQNQALFSLLGTTYGGDGQVNFALPDLRGRIPVHFGDGNGTSTVLGQRGGETAHTLTLGEMPGHTHLVKGSTESAGTATSPLSNNFGASNLSQIYTSTPNTAMNPAGIGTVGGNQPHENMSPYLVLNICIALQGIFPSRN